MPRLAPLDLNKLTPEQKKAADAIVAGPRGGLRGPVRAVAAPARAGRPRAEARRILPLQQLAAARPQRARDLPGRPALQGAVRVLRPCPPRQGSRPLGRDHRGGPHPPDAALHARRRAHRLRLRHRVSRDQPRLGAQLQARGRCLRRAGRGRSGGRVRLLHAGVDDAQRLRDAAAAGRARADRLSAA